MPAGVSVVNTTGAGHQGVRPDEQLKASAAVWQLPRLGATEQQTYTITLSRAATAADNLRGAIRWTMPADEDRAGRLGEHPSRTSGAGKPVADIQTADIGRGFIRSARLLYLEARQSG
jgi:hypothetical protein